MIQLAQATEALARRLATAQRLSVEDAIQQALEERARGSGIFPETGESGDTSPAAIARRQARFDRAADNIAAMPVRDPRSPREIMDDLNDL